MTDTSSSAKEDVPQETTSAPRKTESSVVNDDSTDSDDQPLCRLTHAHVECKRASQEVSFQIPACEFDPIRPLPGVRSLMRGWTNVVYERVHKVIPTCPIVFTYNECSVATARKSQSNFWTGRGQCKFTGCISIRLIIKNRPLVGQPAVVHLTWYGTCNHTGDEEPQCREEHKRKLTGRDRQDVIQQMLSAQETPLSLYQKGLNRMTETECHAGNTTECQSLQVLAKAASLGRTALRIHENVIFEIEHYRCAWLKSNVGAKISGYVHMLALFPFSVVFYTEGQVQQYITYCRQDDPAVLHFDSTGSICKNIPGQKKTFFYSLLMAQDQIPAVEFLTTCHSSWSIATLLQKFMSAVRTLANGTFVKPTAVVTDFSYALINAILSAFNGNLQLTSYLHKTFKYLIDNSNNSLENCVLLNLCQSHFIKSQISKLVRVQPDKQRRKTAMHLFVVMMKAKTLTSCRSVYRLLRLILCTKKNTVDVRQAWSDMQNLLEDVDEPDQDEEETTNEKPEVNDSDDDDIADTKKSIKEQSPFTSYFAEELPDVDDSDDNDDSVPDNPNWCPGVFKCFTDVMHLYSLWSYPLHVYPNEQDEEQHSLRTNGTVENYFGKIKNNRYHYKLNLSPAVFLGDQLEYVTAKLKEQLLPGKRKKTVAVIADTTEKWSRRKKTPKYGNDEAVKKLLAVIHNRKQNMEKQ